MIVTRMSTRFLRDGLDLVTVSLVIMACMIGRHFCLNSACLFAVLIVIVGILRTRCFAMIVGLVSHK
ncbi:hypothetical protein ABAC460_17530 [Asticcacaulis sp. AC460]|nr:hypothetical protein ABAC460_17530 [Asticcacaulis sp. AC460]